LNPVKKILGKTNRNKILVYDIIGKSRTAPSYESPEEHLEAVERAFGTSGRSTMEKSIQEGRLVWSSRTGRYEKNY